MNNTVRRLHIQYFTYEYQTFKIIVKMLLEQMPLPERCLLSLRGRDSILGMCCAGITGCIAVSRYKYHCKGRCDHLRLLSQRPEPF